MNIIYPSRSLRDFPKLCNMNPGEVLMLVRASDGSEVGPYVLMASGPTQKIKLTVDGTLPAPPSAVPSAVCWGESHDARLLDPATGVSYIIHGSTRARPLKHAALLLHNDGEE